MDGFMTPPDHIRFLAKKLFGACGEIIDGAIAYLEPEGGGPCEAHTHPHDHLFIVVSGEACVRTPEGEQIIRANESLLVKGNVSHSVWNHSAEQTVMVGISVRNGEEQQ